MEAKHQMILMNRFKGTKASRVAHILDVAIAYHETQKIYHQLRRLKK